ncbi:MAG: hypothetical protein QNK61_06930 [Akkermansiaceae bacterium]
MIEFTFTKRNGYHLMLKHLIILIPVLLTPFVHAQEGGAEKGYVRVVCLGDPPPFVAREENGVMVGQEAPAGSVPPREVSFSGATVRAEVPETTKLRVRRMTKYIEVANKALPVTIQADNKAWVKLPAPVSPMTVALFRDRSEKKLSWDKVGQKAFKDDLRSFPEGKVRFINMTRVPIAIKMVEAGKAYSVNPGSLKMMGADEGFTVGNNHVAVATKKAGGWKEMFKNRIKLLPRHRLSVYFYESDRQDPKGGIKLKVQMLELMEPAVNPVPNR